jgi:two-component system chemotaxis response regulator CheB
VSAPAAQSRLLAIDDNADSAELIVRVAAKCGYDATTLSDLRALPRMLKEWQPKVVTLDLCMPQEDGIEILSQLKENGFTGALLIVSGQEDWLREAATRLAAARGLNVVADLSKPVDLKALRATLSGLQGGNEGEASAQPGDDLQQQGVRL